MEVDVQGRVGALAECGFHGIAVGAGAHGPGVVVGPGGVDEVELDVVGVVDGVEGGYLLVHHVLGNAGCGDGVGLGHDVEDGGYRDGCVGTDDMAWSERPCVWRPAAEVQEAHCVVEVGAAVFGCYTAVKVHEICVMFAVDSRVESGCIRNRRAGSVNCCGDTNETDKQESGTHLW